MTRRSFFASLAALVGVKCVPAPEVGFTARVMPPGTVPMRNGLVTVYHTYSLPPEYLSQRHTLTTFSMPPVHQPRKLGFIADEPVRQREIQAFKDRIAQDLYARSPSRL